MEIQLPELPGVSRTLVTTEAPSPGVTAGDIAAPYAHLGNALDKLGGAVNDAGVDMAAEAGKRAVTTDDQGNLQVSTLPPIGKAAEAFNRSAQTAYLAQIDPVIQQKVTDMRIASRGDPGAFHDMSQAYTQELADGQPSVELRNSVLQLATRKIVPA